MPATLMVIIVGRKTISRYASCRLPRTDSMPTASRSAHVTVSGTEKTTNFTVVNSAFQNASSLNASM